MCVLSLPSTELVIALVPFGTLNMILIALWCYLSFADPAGEGGFRLRTNGAEWAHYCNHCRKTVPGFDHHCSWLNTCIGARNYGFFYFLGICGSLLYVFMVAIGALFLIFSTKGEQRDAFGTLTGARVGWGVFLAVTGWIAVSFVALAGFHTYLLFVGMGTYDWVVSQNEKRQEKMSSRRRRHSPRSLASSAGTVTASQGRVPGAPVASKGRWSGTARAVGVTPPRNKVAARTSRSKDDKAAEASVVASTHGEQTGGSSFADQSPV
ncbi:unnamed protein product [Ascophyllum nodosum]